MALRSPLPRIEPKGADAPRVGPPSPLHSLADEYVEQATAIGIEPFGWQRVFLHYLTATGPDNRWLYPEMAGIVSRQNGKSLLLVPLIVKRLREGRRIVHTAQNRVLPRTVFERVAEVMEGMYAKELKRKPRWANGQEEILTKIGGFYRIVAPSRGGARGLSCDDVIVDELREMDDFEFISAAEPALAASANPQMIYVSNAGSDTSAVLNALRDRANDDPALAYLEWSSSPERASDDPAGWLEANPSVGQLPGLWSYLERKYQSYRLSGQVGIWETEHLCRWVHTVLPSIIKSETWEELRGEVSPARRPALGVSLDPNGQRASAVLSWQQDDGRVAVRLIADVTGDPIDVPAFGADLKRLAADYHVRDVVFDAATDGELAKYFKKPEAITGSKFTNASSMFVNLAESHTIVWDGEPITPDIEWTGRKTHEAPGTWTAVKLSDDHPITAMLATIRAVYKASGPTPHKPKVH